MRKLYRPALESLEDRVVLGTFVWIRQDPNSDPSWRNPANWSRTGPSDQLFPTARDTAHFLAQGFGGGQLNAVAPDEQVAVLRIDGYNGTLSGRAYVTHSFFQASGTVSAKLLLTGSSTWFGGSQIDGETYFSPLGLVPGQGGLVPRTRAETFIIDNSVTLNNRRLIIQSNEDSTGGSGFPQRLLARPDLVQVRWTGTEIVMQNQSLIKNYGVFVASSNGTMRGGEFINYYKFEIPENAGGNRGVQVTVTGAFTTLGTVGGGRSVSVKGANKLLIFTGPVWSEGGTFSVEQGSKISFRGDYLQDYVFYGVNTFLGGGVVQLLGGNLTVSSLTVPSQSELTIRCGFEWSDDGSIYGPGTFVTEGATKLDPFSELRSDDRRRELSGVTWINRGTVTPLRPVGGWGALVYMGGATIINYGTFDLRADTGFLRKTGSTNNSFLNFGVFREQVSDGGSVMFSNTIPFFNWGIVVVNSQRRMRFGPFYNHWSILGALVQLGPGAGARANGIVNEAGASIVGSRDISSNVNNAGKIAPGASGQPGTISITGDLSSPGRIELDLGDSGSDQVTVTGLVTLGGTLKLTAASTLVGDSFTIVDNLGSQPIVGTFAGLPEDEIIRVGGKRFQIHYDGGDGNDVVLTVSTIGEPSNLTFAGADFYSVIHDQSLSIDAPGVLGNDFNQQGKQLSARQLTSPSNGTLALDKNGSFVYAPNTHFVGTDTFTYKANIAPRAHADAFATLPEYGVTGHVKANDVDDDGDATTAILVSGATNGSLDFSDNGDFAYTPDAGFTGVDSFTYKITDGLADSDAATVLIYVTSDAASFQVLGVDKNGSVGGSVPSGPGLTAYLVSGPGMGGVELNPDGSFVYTPNADEVGLDSFSYRVNDGVSDIAQGTVIINVIEPLNSTGSNNVATVTIEVTNEAPVAVDDEYTVVHGRTLDVAAPGVKGNDYDYDGDALTVALVDGPAHGTVTFNSDGSFIYVSNMDYVGLDSFTYEVDDGPAQSVATVWITVTNELPVAQDDFYGVRAGATLNVSASGVLGNDSDADGDTLTASLVSGPANGTLTFNSDGSFTYTPNAGFTDASDSFQYWTFDGAEYGNVATVTIDVGPSPKARDDSFEVLHDNTLTVSAKGVLGNDTDPDGATLSAILVSGPTNGTLSLGSNGSLTYTPNTNFVGIDTFEYKATNGLAESNVATVTIDVFNNEPWAWDDDYTVVHDHTLTVEATGVLGNDYDADDDPLTAVLVSGPTNGTLSLNADGSFTYTPALQFVGTDTFTYQVDDGPALSAPVTVWIEVTNETPVARNDFYGALPGQTRTIAAPGVLGNDSDADGDTLTGSLVSGVSNGTLSFNSDGSFSYTSNANFEGTDSFTYIATDGIAESDVATVTIDVGPLPKARGDAYSVAHNHVLEVAASGVLGNDTDPQGDALSAILVAGPTNGTVSLSAGGGFVYTPNENYVGSDSFTYKASDGFSESSPATVTIEVTNSPPVANDDNAATLEDEGTEILSWATTGTPMRIR